MTKSEMRAIRRQIINEFIHDGWETCIRIRVRTYELYYFGKELKAYE